MTIREFAELLFAAYNSAASDFPQCVHYVVHLCDIVCYNSCSKEILQQVEVNKELLEKPNEPRKTR